jgi:hypothetical protein
MSENIKVVLRILLSKYGYLEKMIPLSSTSISLENDVGNEIVAKIIKIPHSQEMLIYLKAPHLLAKIIDFKVNPTLPPQKLKIILHSNVILTLFPPTVLVPALGFLNRELLTNIMEYLSV